MKTIRKVRFSFNPALQQMSSNTFDGMIYIPGLRYIRGGNLFHFVVKNRKSGNQRHLNSLAPKVAKQLLNGLKHTHSKDIINRDIKPENLLLAEDVTERTHNPLKFVIGEFGIARSPGEKITETRDLKLDNVLSAEDVPEGTQESLESSSATSVPLVYLKVCRASEDFKRGRRAPGLQPDQPAATGLTWRIEAFSKGFW
ncbi:hypothetical protein FRC00_005566 [Tulasnella sp. 408]|nr:hypothetical protein FRC00_005566 [Tulasnella sp. 408]